MSLKTIIVYIIFFIAHPCPKLNMHPAKWYRN